MPFNMFPYTDLQNLNLDWLLKSLKDLGDKYESLEADLNGKTIAEIVTEYLQQLQDSGQLDDIITNALMAQKFVQTDEEYEEYADAMARAVASYICNMAPGTSDCVIGSPNRITPFIAKYCDEYSVIYSNLMRYDAIVDNVLDTFGHYSTDVWNPTVVGNHDEYTYNGVDYPVYYNNCSGFVTLLTKNRYYGSDPSYLLFTDSTATARKLAAKTVENGDTDVALWTFDFMNVLYTWRMCEIMRSSGNTPFMVAAKDSGEINWDPNEFARLRDGDILFSGNPGNHPDRLHGISHCMMFFKDLNRLKEAAQVFGADALRAYDSAVEDAAWGYIAHCSGGTDGGVGIKNAFRIETLEHWLGTLSNGSELWGCNAAANALNSSKLHQAVTGDLVMFSCVITNSYRHQALDRDEIPVYSVRALASGTYNGTYAYGQYRYQQPATSYAVTGGTIDFDTMINPRDQGIYCVTDTGVNIVNGPTSGNTTDPNSYMATPTNAYFMFEIKDITGASGYCVQTVTVLYHDNPHKFERVINYGTGNASTWNVLY